MREIRLAIHVVGTVTENLNDNVGGVEHRGSVGKNLCALIDVLRVRVTSLNSCITLNHNFEACFSQSWDDGGNQSYPPLAGIIFFGNANDHEIISLADEVLGFEDSANHHAERCERHKIIVQLSSLDTE
jgi:hypothetical protein